jgi:hypothetical protein
MQVCCRDQDSQASPSQVTRNSTKWAELPRLSGEMTRFRLVVILELPLRPYIILRPSPATCHFAALLVFCPSDNEEA